MLKTSVRSVAKRTLLTLWNGLGSDQKALFLERLSEGMQVEVNIADDMSLRLDASTVLLQRRAQNLLGKEPDLIRWIDELPSDATMWDIGANIGTFSLYAAKKKKCKVVAVEPAAANFHALTRNVSLNGLADRIDAYCLALSGVTGLGVLNLSSEAMGAALGQFGEAGAASPWSDGPVVAVHGMLAFTIDDFIARFAPPFPTHMKIDVDGLELAIVDGARCTLADQRLRGVALELSLTDETERNKGVEMMKKAGLNYVSHGPDQSLHGDRAANHYFAR